MKKDITKQETEELKQKLQDYEEKYKRALADYQNLEKRSAEERKEIVRIANKQLVLHLLPILDTLILSENHVKDQGLTLAIKQFRDVLKSDGVDKIEALGKNFDPRTMECVEVKEGKEGEVLEEVRSGYWYSADGEIIRPAQIKAGKEKINNPEELQKGDLV